MAKKLRLTYFFLTYFLFLFVSFAGFVLYFHWVEHKEWTAEACRAVRTVFFDKTAIAVLLLAIAAAALFYKPLKTYRQERDETSPVHKIPTAVWLILTTAGLFLIFYGTVFILDFFKDISGLHLAHECGMKSSLSLMLNIFLFPLFITVLINLLLFKPAKK